MKYLKDFKRNHQVIERSEEGSVVVASLFILVIVSFIALSSSQRSFTESTVASNDKFYKMAFHAADSGIHTIPKLISEAVDERTTPGTLTQDDKSYGGITYLYPGTADNNTSAFTLYRELAGFQSGGEEFSYQEYNGHPADVIFSIGEVSTTAVNMTRKKIENIAGGGVEFGTGNEGVATRMQGISYELDAFGHGPRGSVAKLGAVYYKVIGVAGGL